MTATTDSPDVHVEVTDLDEPTPAGLQITARLVRGSGARELTVKFGPDADLPTDDEILAITEQLADQVWGEKSNLHHREARPTDREWEAMRRDRGQRGARGRRGHAQGPFMPGGPV